VLGREFPQEKAAGRLPEELLLVLEPLLATLASLIERIREYDRRLEALAEDFYPQTRLLRQVYRA
jgi:transposase